MADTLTTQTAGLASIPTATVIATDDAGAGGHVQIMKLALSADGSATPITADANGLEVQGAGTAGTPAGGVMSVQGVASGTVLPVGDGSGTLTVDAPVGTPVFVRLSDGSAAISTLPVSVATVPSHAVTNAGTFAVQESGGALTALQLIDNIVNTEDIAHNSGDAGVMLLAVRRDAASSGVSTDGDYAALSVTSDGSLRVSGSAGTTQYAEDAAHNSGDSVVFVGAIRRDTTPSSSAGTAGDYAAINVDANGRLYVNATLYAADGSALTADTQGTHDTALGTIGSVTGGINMVRASASAPTAVSADDDGVIPWAFRNGAQAVSAVPNTTSGLSTFMASGSDGSSILVATAQAIKASAGQLYGYYIYNPESAVTFVHFYNTAAGSVTVGTTAPLFTIPVPATSAANLMFPHGVTFSNAGWSAAATTTAGGNTAPATGASLVAWYV